MKKLTIAGKGGLGMRPRLIAAAAVPIGMVMPANFLRFECFDRHGRLKWIDEVQNLVVNEGLNDLLSKYFKGSGYTAAWFVGLTDDTPTVAAGDTLASHAGWAEANPYTGNRKTLTLGSVASQSVDNSASPASFAITGSDDVGGAFIASVNSGTSGILYGAAAFSGGDRAVVSGDTLNVTVTLTAAAA